MKNTWLKSNEKTFFLLLILKCSLSNENNNLQSYQVFLTHPELKLNYKSQTEQSFFFWKGNEEEDDYDEGKGKNKILPISFYSLHGNA